MDDTPDDVFADTCVLLNFVQQEWERDRSSALVESDAVGLVVSRNVLEELSDVSDRRRDIYSDMIDFMVETEAGIEEYDPSERHVYVGKNDAGHIRQIQGELAMLADRNRVQKRLRRFVREAGRRVDHLESLLADEAIDPFVPLGLRFAVDRILDHDADTKVLTDAAAWSANGGSGVLVTLDNEHLLDKEARLVEVIVDEQGPEWSIEINPPDDIVTN